MPAAASASAPSRISPSTSAVPRPIATLAIAAMCMRSDAPTEPIAGTTGWTPCFSMATSCRATPGSPPPRRARGPPAEPPSRPGRPQWAAGRRRRRRGWRPSPPGRGRGSRGHALVAHVAEARVQAVDERLAVHELVDDGAGRFHPCDGFVGQDRGRAAGDPDDVVDGCRPAPDLDRFSGDAHERPIRRARRTAAASPARRTAAPSRRSRGTPCRRAARAGRRSRRPGRPDT